VGAVAHPGLGVGPRDRRGRLRRADQPLPQSAVHARPHRRPGGEIDILDPAGYGQVTITKSISIVNDGVGTAGVQASSGNGVTINAGSADSVYLRGLNIDGQGGAGTDGIEFLAGKRLKVIGCVIRHFSADGIALFPLSGLPVITILDTVSADNGSGGIKYFETSGAAASLLTIDHADLVDNHAGWPLWS